MPDYSKTKIQVRRGTSSQWASTNAVLASGELGYDHGSGVLKVGNGVTGWNSLATVGGGGGGSSTFVGLSDTPANFSGAGSKFVKVNSSANAVEFATGAGDVSQAEFDLVSGVAIYSSGQAGLLNTSSGNLNTSVGLLETASGALNTSVGLNTSNTSIVSGISVHSVSGSIAYSSTASGNISGVNTTLVVDQAAYNALNKQNDTIYFIT